MARAVRAEHAGPRRARRAKSNARSPALSHVINLRADAATRSLIDRAASVAGQTRTEFMLSSARERAIDILLNQRLFVLNEANWAAFVEGLDNPPPANAKLKALLARVPIWDRQ
jgi:uncharacterized protein (DUF1778 family)